MKKLISKVALTSGLLLVVTVLPAGAATSSTTQTQKKPDGSTNMVVTLQQNPDRVEPVDPAKPDQPATNIPGNGMDNTKPLSPLQLVFVPSSINFGKYNVDVINPITAHPIDTDDNTTKSAKTTSEMADTPNQTWNHKMVLEVSDARGTRAGWHLTVSGNGLNATTDGNPAAGKSSVSGSNANQAKTLDTIKGAKLKLDTGKITTAKNDVVADRASSIVVDDALSENESTIINAKAGTGYGLTMDEIDRNDVTLTIPANEGRNYVYSTELDWNLSNVPDTND
ncbi:WxL domain-containing protein [Lactiplantibacillus fabifermentans]|uniref:WxL domain-containing protein n=2 Tax=Lactiplantibacillus fabifermentans TaxID=483011 RepID=A0A0R2NT86_9LACO|nr:WxL domain-containing protein [Lactiplantibacillus fabifermentans]ETY75124.1 hypothetical protein LFAB_03630 [Lactiplantibacillus fabifermentans T30PCM01]KRO28889.1 hypothetical protein DY78_GL001878 [Lactiplantibacillus fabifermentans DSM 21115]